ncbi:MAG: hypothetical protein IPH30_13455 [Betaproteobacteria bacterium]|jgi:hypothetical protein|nr:hypothetical protein [Betaproteobacteria bacterium]
MGLRNGLYALATVMLAGCAALSLEPGVSPEGKVREVLGEPAMAFVGSDGSRQLVFPHGPAGTETTMAYIAPDGRLARLEQALTEDRFRRISAGKTSRSEVERLIGPPWRTIDFPNKRQVAWDYRFRDAWGYLAEFSVMLDERGIVAETVTQRLERELPEATTR